MGMGVEFIYGSILLLDLEIIEGVVGAILYYRHMGFRWKCETFYGGLLLDDSLFVGFLPYKSPEDRLFQNTRPNFRKLFS